MSCHSNSSTRVPSLASSQSPITQIPITNAVLLSIFPSISRLHLYLELNLDIHNLELIHDDDPPEYKDLLYNTLIANSNTSTLSTSRASEPALPATTFPTQNRPNPHGCQDEIVDRAIDQTCPRTRGWFHGSFNILAVGYTNTRQAYFQQATNYFPNTLELFMRSQPWQTLLTRIGDAAMLFLLTRTSMFAALPNNCYCQITGPAISEQAVSKRRLQRESRLSSSPRKKRPASAMQASQEFSPPELLKEASFSSEVSTSSSSTATSEASATTIISSNIFTESPSAEGARTRKKKRTGRMTTTSSTSPTMEVTPAAVMFKRSRMFYVRRYHTESTMLRHFLLSDYGSLSCGSSSAVPSVDSQLVRMFPRQYGQENVFVPRKVPKVTQGKEKNSHSWRLRQIRALVDEMLKMNSKCKFEMLLRHYCPVKALDEPSQVQDTSAAALLKCNSSFEQVTSFVHAIVKKVIPLAMFGSLENRNVILQAMTRFIRLRKFETVSLQYVLQGFKWSDCAWLQDSKLGVSGTRVSHVPQNALDKQRQIAHEFVYWMFDGFLIPLLQAGFYVTDSSYQRNKILYYRHGLWHMVTKPALASIQNDMFMQMDQEEVAACSSSYGKVRLLPKEQGLRPIVNLRRKNPRLVNGNPSMGLKSRNQQLTNAFLVLAYERQRHLSQQTSSAVGMSDLYQRFKQVQNKLVRPSEHELPKLYMVKIDIKKSFDSINQGKLLSVIERILEDDKYMIHRHSKLMPSSGHILKRFLPRAVPPSDMPSFLEFACEQAGTSKHAVFVDKVVHSFEARTAILDLIREHVHENIIKFGKLFYRQTTGIPQGSILSPALCRFFYDEMEHNVLSDFSHGDDCALLRLADDFLFISQNREKALQFLQTMSDGHPDYGCYINESKTITNFDAWINGKSIQTCQGNEFPYCGLLVHAKTLEIRVDYSRYHDEDVRNLLTVGRDMHPGRSIVLKMKKAMQHTCQMALSDTTFNSLPKVLLNIYQNFVFCAMKFHAYLQELCLDPVSAIHIQRKSLPAIVLSVFEACYGLLQNGRRSAVGLAAGAKFKVPERHVHWLGANAFMNTLPRHEAIYEPLRAMLRENILRPMARDEKVHFKRMLHSVVKDRRNTIMEHIRYQ